ncbi:MAG: hypothetical protein ABI977_32930 [Acidobacteriota bacterium]
MIRSKFSISTIRKVSAPLAAVQTSAPSIFSEELDEVRAGKAPRLEVGDERTGREWNAGASHLNEAFPKSYFDRLGLISLLDQLRKLQFSI